MLVKWPGVGKAGGVSRAMVSNVDLAETFLDAAGLPVPGDMQGVSLRPVMQGNTPGDWRRSFYYHYYEFPGAHSVARHCGVRTERYTLAHYYQKNEWELFDRESDPRQLRNVAGSPAHAKVLAELKAEMQRLRVKLEVPDQDPPAPLPAMKKRPG
jgi:arylsulfatase A-like enzyme